MGKHKTQHSMRLQNIILSFLLLGLISCNSADSVFTDETYQDTIKQNIGGLLIRNIHHYDDFQSIIYDIDYSIDNNSDTLNYIGSGSFYNQKPPKDEQILKLGELKIFKVCGDRDKDFIFICDSNNVWTKYEISSKTIQETELWRKQKINAQVANWDNVAKVSHIDKSGKLSVIYKYAKNKRIFSFMTEKRQIDYKINLQTGELSIDKIIEL